MIGNTTAFRPSYRRSCNSCSSAQKAQDKPMETKAVWGARALVGSRREKGGMGTSMVGGCRKPPKLYSIGILTAVPLPTFPWHWVLPISSYVTTASSTYSFVCATWPKHQSLQSSNAAGTNHLVQQIYISLGITGFDLGAYCMENTAKGRENMIKHKHRPKPRRWQGWRNPTLWQVNASKRKIVILRLSLS